MFRAFTDHPATVGESYLEHMQTASWFAVTMLAGSVACLIHAILPFACQTSGSRRIKLLHERMVTHRHRTPATHTDAAARSDVQGFLGYAEGI
jgi:hypothetical protein